MSRLFEIIAGFVVLAVCAAALAYALPFIPKVPRDLYTVKATFGRGEGIAPGIAVRIAGVKVGRVTDVVLDPTVPEVVVTMGIGTDIALSTDTRARLVGNLFTGIPVIDLFPGNEKTAIVPGGSITRSSEVLSLEDMISSYLFDNKP